ncbi:ABC transporter related [Desulfatibacillum aliphaticivorans]|uniref:ABC transporter related n=1 Tax=Desulfatibacillum aliphaticivorans TaxID=218208 RepID=B8FJX5_DESAL|nr:ABC transporter ATP-binding protein [Desulfatibacillum aliphaticivorans]ACL02403.1 ABC transporter related [Desulfatibacillum aliphaticivorans]
MLEAIHLTKKFGELVAVNDLSFKVDENQIFGIAGPNGAGKSTVYNLITGFYPFDGKLLFNGKNIAGKKPHQIAKMGIARTFQVPRTFPSLTVEEALSVGSRFGDGNGFDSEYVDFLLHFLNFEEERSCNTGALDLLGKKKLMMGAALATRPKLLMLDEPMAGSNAHEIQELMDFIRRINEEMGVTIIIIEHFMKVLTELTETLLIIESGAKIASGDPEDVTNDKQVVECYLGDAYASDN